MARCVLALGPDSDGALLHHLLDRSATALDVAVYELGPGYALHLAHAARRGVAVRVLLDGHGGANSTSTAVLHGSGAEVRVLDHRGADGGEAHWKLLVTATTVATGSGNLLHRDAPEPGQPGTREWWAAVAGADAVQHAARDAFEAAWSGAAPPPLTWHRAAAAPEHIPPVGVPTPEVASLTLTVPAARLRLVLGGESVCALLAERLAAARRRALVTVPYVHTRVAPVHALLDQLCRARARGADVRLLLGAPPEPRDAAALAATPLSVRVMDPRRSTTGHAKGLVADAAAVVSSANWSGLGLGANRESALLLDHARAADWFAAALDRDWAVAVPLPQQVPDA